MCKSGFRRRCRRLAAQDERSRHCRDRRSPVGHRHCPVRRRQGRNRRTSRCRRPESCKQTTSFHFAVFLRRQLEHRAASRRCAERIAGRAACAAGLSRAPEVAMRVESHGTVRILAIGVSRCAGKRMDDFLAPRTIGSGRQFEHRAAAVEAECAAFATAAALVCCAEQIACRIEGQRRERHAAIVARALAVVEGVQHFSTH